eukprot:10066528-Lingulodinium_polyedra.AAC.1
MAPRARIQHTEAYTTQSPRCGARGARVCALRARTRCRNSHSTVPLSAQRYNGTRATASRAYNTHCLLYTSPSPRDA